MKKIKCAMIGPGNIGTDFFINFSAEWLEPVWMVVMYTHFEPQIPIIFLFFSIKGIAMLTHFFLQAYHYSNTHT